MHITAGRLSYQNKFVLALLCTAIGVFVWALASPGSRASAQRPSSAYSLLDRSPTPADTAIRNEINNLAKAAPEIQAEDARVIRRAVDETLVLVPRSDDQLCVERLRTDGTAGGGCVARGVAETAGIAFTIGPNIGVVPDGVDRVDFTLRDGSHTTSPVDGNVYRVPAEATEGTLVLDGSTYSIAFIPRSALPKSSGRPGEGKVIDMREESCWSSCR